MIILMRIIKKPFAILNCCQLLFKNQVFIFKIFRKVELKQKSNQNYKFEQLFITIIIKMIAQQILPQEKHQRMIALDAFKQQYVRPSGQLKSQYDGMLQIDCTFVGLQKNVIVLLGQSKTGKSTLSNILAARPMVGKDNGYGQVVYEALTGDALNNQGYLVSCTTVCNKLDFKDISIIDLAGFQQTRGQKQLLAVIYNIKKLFESGANVKFLLTISDNEMSAHLAKDKFRPYYNFLSLFRDFLDKQELMKKIFNATLMIFTKTTQKIQIYTKKMKGAIKALENPAITIDMKEQIKKFLQFMDEQQRYDVFPMAQEGIPPKQIDIFQKKNWEYINIKQEKDTYGKFWNQNFKGLFDKMDGASQTKFNQIISSRVESFKNAQDVLQSIVNICSSKNAWYQDKIDYSSVTQKIQELSKINDYYTSPHLQYVYALTGQLSAADQNGNVKQASGLELIRQLKNIYQKVNKLSQIMQKQTKKQAYKDLFSILKSVFQSFKIIYCSSSKEQELFLNFSFNYLRGVLQFSQLEEISSLISSFASITIADSFADIFSETIYMHQYNFIQNMTPQINKKLFDSHQKRDQYKQYVDQFYKSCSSQGAKTDYKKMDVKKMRYTQIMIEIATADYLIKDEKKKPALEALLNVIEKIKQYQEDLKNSLINQPNESSQKHLKQVEMLMIITIKKIALGLSKTKNLMLAIKLYDFIDYPLCSIECRKKLIQQTNDEMLVFDYQIQLGKYCQKVGKTQLALDSYYSAMQKAMKVAQREEALNKIRDIGQVKMENFIQRLDEKSIEAPSNGLISQIRQFVQKIIVSQGNKSIVSGSGNSA